MTNKIWDCILTLDKYKDLRTALGSKSQLKQFFILPQKVCVIYNVLKIKVN